MSFTSTLLDDADALWHRMLGHRFLQETRDGVIAEAIFARWMRQDYRFVEAACPMLAALISKAPPAHRPPLTDALRGLYDELDLFRERGRAVGIDLENTEPAFICHAYIQFLLATAHRGSYAEGFTVLYGAEKAYHEAWKVVAEGLDPHSTWQPFVENWAGEAFGAYVSFLESTLDDLAARTGENERERMADLFTTTLRYEVAFWELAYTEADWPGLET